MSEILKLAEAINRLAAVMESQERARQARCVVKNEPMILYVSGGGVGSGGGGMRQ